MIEGLKPIRLKTWEYTMPGAYFVTACTHFKEMLFLDARFAPAVEQCWLDVPKHHHGVQLDEFVVMPNHVHGVVWITGEERAEPGQAADSEKEAGPPEGIVGCRRRVVQGRLFEANQRDARHARGSGLATELL